MRQLPSDSTADVQSPKAAAGPMVAGDGGTAAEQPAEPMHAKGSPQGAAAITAIAAAWIGNWSNARQVEATLERGGPPMPELTRERRRMRVVRLEAPQLGETVLYFEEERDSLPGLAHRQRVVSLVLEGEERQPRARQLFFRDGPTYDRPPLDPATVAVLAPEALRHEAGCDLFFDWEAAQGRWRGSMKPCACRYRHPESGWVYADFTMLLLPGQLWYRDRSLLLESHTPRGEVDGFSWLLFDRLDEAAPCRGPLDAGVWRGIFRRYGPDGELLEAFASEVVARLRQDGDTIHYHQTNLYRPAKGPPQRIESFGEVRQGRVWFRNERVSGCFLPLPGDPEAGGNGERCGLLTLHHHDGSGLSVRELVVVSADGRRRWRDAQYLREGQLVRRTLIDEEKVNEDWRAWDVAHPG